MIVIADNLSLDASEVATGKLAIVAAPESGKTYLAGRLVEQLAQAGAPFCVVDPVGNWNSLTLGADGVSPGLPVVVIGGERADVPFHAETTTEQALAIGRYLVTESVLSVLDVSELDRANLERLTLAFAEGLYQGARKKRSPYHLVFEEAQTFFPEGMGRLPFEWSRIVMTGRNYGLGVTFLTVRPQAVAKEVINLCSILFVGRLFGEHERKRVDGWVTEKAPDDASWLDALSQLERQVFLCWRPSAEPRVLRVQSLPKWTYDGSLTPQLGLSALPQRIFGERGIARALEGLAALEKAPKGATEAELGTERAELAALRLDLAQAKSRVSELESFVAAFWTQALEQVRETERLLPRLMPSREAQLPGQRESTEARSERDAALYAEHAEAFAREAELDRQVVAAASEPDGPEALVVKMTGAPAKEAFRRPELPAAPERERKKRRLLDGSPEQRICHVLAVHGPMDKKRLALLARYAPKGGGFTTLLSRMGKEGYIEWPEALYQLTIKGRKLAGDVKALGTLEPLFDEWLNHPQVSSCLRGILTALWQAPEGLDKSELAERAGVIERGEPYAASGGGFVKALSRGRTLGLVRGTGQQRLVLAKELRLGRKAAAA